MKKKDYLEDGYWRSSKQQNGPVSPRPSRCSVHWKRRAGYISVIAFCILCCGLSRFQHKSSFIHNHKAYQPLGSASSKEQELLTIKLQDKILELEDLEKRLEARDGARIQDDSTSAKKELLKELEKLKGRIGTLREEESALEVSIAEKKAADHVLPLKDSTGKEKEEAMFQFFDPSYNNLNTSEDSHRPWLTIGIPSFARPNNVDYLGQTLASIAQEFPTDPLDPFHGKIHVVVMNNYGEGHATYEVARKRYAAPHPLSWAMQFHTNDDHLRDPLGANQKDEGSPNKPGVRVRKQSRDLVALLRASKGRLSKYYLFLEDDMLFCPHALLSIKYLMTKAEAYHPNWISVRASYGMNGIFMRGKDLLAFADYLLEHQARRPPDHLVVEWFAGEKPQTAQYRGKRQHVSFRYNLFHHIGSVSSLREAKQVSFPECYEPLGEPVLFAVEAFKPAQCPNDDIWPCHSIPEEVKKRFPLLKWGELWQRHGK